MTNGIVVLARSVGDDHQKPAALSRLEVAEVVARIGASKCHERGIRGVPVEEEGTVYAPSPDRHIDVASDSAWIRHGVGDFSLNERARLLMNEVNSISSRTKAKFICGDAGGR